MVGLATNKITPAMGLKGTREFSDSGSLAGEFLTTKQSTYNQDPDGKC
jgi:hypothetical protein